MVGTLLRVILAGSWVLAMGLAGLWLVLPWYTPLALAAGVAIAAVISLGAAAPSRFLLSPASERYASHCSAHSPLGPPRRPVSC